ncbi:acyl-CoA synthetase (AMP-forming)/AMP-acid ligase II [Arenibacter algicola]|uniref:Acyl-CoA synthetase (AMP-forming)/AMP-acid ligase II n=1 Tax=Arenibacter algicola TaxID=616991 RepID=A0ABY3ADI9_9FLAO
MTFSDKYIQAPQRLLGDGLINSAHRYPTKTAIIVKNTTYTYGQLNTDAMKLAHALIERGIEPGDRVAIYMENSWACAVSIFGASLAGAVFLVVNPQTKANKLQYILNDSGAKALIANIKLQRELQEACLDVMELNNVIVVGANSKIILNDSILIENFNDVLELVGRHDKIKLPQIIPNDLASLIYTSGSTGFPKGVMMTHQSMVFTIWSLIEYLRIDNDDRIMLVLPLAFDYGLYQLLMSVASGATLIMEPSFIFLGNIYKQVEENKATIFPGVPTTYAMMVASFRNKPFSLESIKKVTNTAASLPPDYIPILRKIFPNALIFKMYGLTECKRVSYLEPELLDEKVRSVGKAIPGTETFIMTIDGKKAKPNESGILYVRGPHIMVGYWNQEERSKKMLVPGELPWERVLCTHDLFKMDEEGFLYFLGRSDDIIKTRGEKVSPLEIENVLLKLKGVKESAVVGIPDEIQGQIIKAFISVDKGIHLTEKEVRKFCNAHLESFMVPEKIVFLDELPKSSNRKVDKKILMEND